MNHVLNRIAVLSVLSGLAQLASAQPLTLTVVSGTASMSVTGTNPYSATIHVTAGSPCVFTLSTSAANTVLTSVEVECDADCLMTIDEHSGGTFAMIGDVLEKSTSSPESFEIDRIFISGDLGSGTPLEYRVAAEVISRLEIGGDLTSEVTAGPRSDNSESNIFLIDVAGTLVGDIYAQYGSIGTIAVGGNIGWPQQMTYIWAMHGIDSIDAGAVNAFIAATMEDPMAHINHIHITGDFTGMLWTAALEDSTTVPNPGATFEGHCNGNLYLGRLDVPVLIQGDVTGELYTNGILPGVTLDIMGSVVDAFVINWFGGLGGLIRIAGNLDGDSSFYNFFSTIAYESTPGQVIINAANNGGEWIGAGWVDPLGVQLLPQPAYAQTGLVGAVGEVPFRLHGGDCNPEDGEHTVPNAFTVTLAFYGPVKAAGGFPFIVEYIYIEDPEIWIDDSERWSIETGLGTHMVGLLYFDGTEPSVIPSGREYRITPILSGSSALLCDKLLTTSDVPVADFEYRFFTP